MVIKTKDERGAAVTPSSDLVPIETSDHMHTPQIENALENAERNLRRGLSTLRVQKQKSGTMLICAGGPSIKRYVEQIRYRTDQEDCPIFAINDTYDYLMEQGIQPRYFAMVEIKPWPKEFLVHANAATQYLMCDISSPLAFDRLNRFPNVRIWHLSSQDDDPFTKPYQDIVERYDPGANYMGGGEAVSIKALNISMAMGFRDFEMYGVDGCYQRGEQSHAYMERKFVEGRMIPPVFVECAGKKFQSAYYLARQADDLRRMCQKWHWMFKLRCYGDGLVQHMHRTGWPEQYKTEEGTAPPDPGKWIMAHRAMSHGI